MNFPVLKFLLIIFVILGIHFAFVVAEAENEPEEPTSEEFKNVLVQNLRHDYNKGCTEMLTFFQTLNKTIADLAQQVANLEAKSNSNFQAIRTDVNSTNIQLTAKIDNLQINLVALETKTDNINIGLTTKLVNLESTAKSSSLGLALLMRGLTLSWTEVDNIIQSKPAVQTGKSFNGSNLSTIKSRVASAGANGEYTVVVFVNHLDKAITDFTIYNEKNVPTYNVGPASIPAHTKEILTFAAVSQQTFRHIAFSYAIPSTDVRIAALSWNAGEAKGLAFVYKNTDMKSYWDSKQGIAGSSVVTRWVDRNLSVGYQNYYARMFMDSEGDRKGTLYIELIGLP